MLQTFVITLREGVEAALVIAIAVAWLRKTGRLDLMPAVYRALVSAVFACFLAAWGFTKIGLNDDAYEGWTLLVSAVFVLSMVVWMNRHGARLKGEIETRLQKDSTRDSTTGSGSWGVFLFVFLMIFREGVETVLMLFGVIRLDTSGILEGLGGVLGIGLAVLLDRKSTRLNSSHVSISYAVFCLQKKNSQDLAVCGLYPQASRAQAFPRTSAARAGDCACFFFNDTATTEIYTLSLHDALPTCYSPASFFTTSARCASWPGTSASSTPLKARCRSEEHTSELQSRFDLVCRL